MNTMQPIIASQIDQHQDYLYEVKYDGFRVLIYLGEKQITLTSRKGIDLTGKFPEIVEACQQLRSSLSSSLPIILDGELVILNNPLQGNFSKIQSRGRLNSPHKILQEAAARPATFIAFDLLVINGSSIKETSLMMRKKQLQKINKYMDGIKILPAEVYTSYSAIKDLVFTYQAEGIVAKRKSSKYRVGKHDREWLKEKNWRKLTAFLIAYDPQNGYFDAAVYDEGQIKKIGQCKHGLDAASQSTLQKIFIESGEKRGPVYELPPAICARINTLDMIDFELREPNFEALLPQIEPEECTWNQLVKDLAMLPNEVQITNEDKFFWPGAGLMKIDHIIYMRFVYPLMSPYIANRKLTIIRCPDGVQEECFFQKHLPSYAPEFISSHDQKVTCDNLASMIWHANHSAIEFHVPFTNINSDYPDYIIFDLDPPTREAFPMAVKAAKMFKEIFDELELSTFIKTSGNKGLQIHLPLPFNTFSYEQTAAFTEKIAHIIVEAAPDLCTIERFKQNRKGRLYIDFVQHGRNKTIIAPYSPRKVSAGTVATPLYWDEVTESLTPDRFTLKTVPERIRKRGCPWMTHYEHARNQSLKKALPLFK